MPDQFQGYHRTGLYLDWDGAVYHDGISSSAGGCGNWGGVVQDNAGWNSSAYLWTGILAAIFALYGMALSAASTPFAALLVDVSDEQNRSKLVGVVWSMLMVGIVVGAVIISLLLKRLTLETPLPELQSAINRVFLIVPAIVVGLAIVATAGVEKKYSRYGSRSSLVDREDQITLGRALRVLTASRQTGNFSSRFSWL